MAPGPDDDEVVDRPFEVEIVQTARAVHVNLRGDLDDVGSAQLDVALDALLRSEPARTVIELKDVATLTSSGIRTLVRAWNWAVDRDETTLVITGASPSVRRIFEACGLLGILWE